MTRLSIATLEDAAAIRALYAPYVQQTAFTFENELPSVGEIEARIGKGLIRFPWIVCRAGNDLAGYVYASAHRDREAYQWTCECSVYLDPRFHGRGLAVELYNTLFQLLRVQGFRTVYAGITLPNEASVRLHEKCGFSHFATYDKVGYKLGQWQKVGWWGLQLNDYNPEPAPPLGFSAIEPYLLADLLHKGSAAAAARLTD